MYRLRASREFSRFFVHGIRNGQSEWDAAGEAMLKAKREMAALLKADTTLTPTERQIEWVNVIEFLMAFYMNMKDLPIDSERVEQHAATQNRDEENRIKTKTMEVIPGHADHEARANPIE